MNNLDMVLIGIPGPTKEVLEALSIKMGKSIPDVVSESIRRLATQLLTDQDFKKQETRSK